MQIKRKIPLNTKKTLVNIKKDDYADLKQKLLEFCKEPRTIHEIREYVPLDVNRRSITRHLLKPLIDCGVIKYTIPENPDSLHQMYLNAEVERTPEVEEKILQKSKKKSTIEMQEKVLEFCKQPRTINEITKFLGKTWNQDVGRRILKPLIGEGKLRFRYPHHGSNQQYINTEIIMPIISEESILEFCKLPRFIKEIREHFEMTTSVYSSTVKPLIKTGKLIYTTEYEKVNKYNVQRKLTSSLDWAPPVRVPRVKKPPKVKSLKTINSETGFTIEQEILEYCNKPRTIYQLKEFLGFKTKTTTSERFITPLVKQGKLKFIYPESPCSNYQRYLSAEIEFTAEMEAEIVQKKKTAIIIELEQKTLEFCKEPKSSGEIMKHLQLNDYKSVMRVIKPLMAEGKIKFKYSHDPHYINQRYVIAEWKCFPISFTEENLIIYCKTPRYKYEIGEYFDIGKYSCNILIDELVEKHRLKYIKCDIINKNKRHGMLISNG